MGHDVFISYSHRDTEAFRQACAEYRRFHISVYTDELLEAGAQYERELERMITQANVFHLLWSPHTAVSTECRKEWMTALAREPSERSISTLSVLVTAVTCTDVRHSGGAEGKG